MASVLRFSALAAMISAVSGYALGQMPSQTIGMGLDIVHILPTAAPELELVKRSLKKKALTNTCSEWTISDGLGYTPICDLSATCLFTSADDGNLYEGCGQTSIAYNWITECFNYNSQTREAPVSQTYCPALAPYCGYFMFVMDSQNTYWNFGCSDTPYSSTAFLVASSLTALAGGSTTITEAPTVTVTQKPDTSFFAVPTFTDGSSSSGSSTDTITSGSSVPSGSFSGSSSNPTIKSHGSKKKKKPIGGIVGGVVGGIAIIAIAALIAWFLRRRQRNQAGTLASAPETTAIPPPVDAAAAYHANNRISEIGSDPKPPTVYPPTAGYGQQNYSQGNYTGPEKPVPMQNTQEIYQPPTPGQQAPSTYGSELSSASPPPVYAVPSPSSPPPASTYPPSAVTELEGGRNSVPPPSVTPISPVGTYSNVAHSPSVSELGSAQPQRGSELGGSEFGALQQHNRASSGAYQAYNPPMPEMSAVAPAVQRGRQSGVDMSGAPMSEGYTPHEMA